jgi:hypothetical protein
MDSLRFDRRKNQVAKKARRHESFWPMGVQGIRSDLAASDVAAGGVGAAFHFF